MPIQAKPSQTPATRKIRPLCNVSEIALMIVLGAAGGIGKTSVARLATSFCEAADLPVQTIRVETGVRKDEFAPQDIIIDLDGVSEAAIGLGGEAAIFEPAWPTIERAIAGGCVAVIDGGANSHVPILSMASLTRLGQEVAGADRRTVVFVVTAPDGESARQASSLVLDARERIPEAIIVLVVNYATPAERLGVDTPQAREFDAVLRGLGPTPLVVLPFAKGQALPAFGQTPFLRIKRASPEDLRRMTGAGPVQTAAARSYFDSWWLTGVRQLQKLFPVR